MQLHEMQGLLASKCLPADMKVNESLAEWFMRKFAERDALAAENTALKQFPEQIVSFVGKLGTSEVGRDTREKIETAAKKIKTPATDAAIAEIELKTIRELVSKVSDDLKQEGQSARRISHLDFTWAYIETVRAEMHNANLRAGRKG